MELFSIRKIHRICRRGCGSGPSASAHGSTNFIKRRLLATGSMAWIKPIESVSQLSSLIRRLRELAPAGGGAGSRSRRRVMAERGGSPEFKFS
jgi:hypothetical protein